MDSRKTAVLFAIFCIVVVALLLVLKAPSLLHIFRSAPDQASQEPGQSGDEKERILNSLSTPSGVLTPDQKRAILNTR
jgi:hypothetical protein